MNEYARAHEASGRFFEAEGVRSFVIEQGEGDPVVLVHGVPASSYLYRKVVPGLAARGLRGVAFDLPGLGLADRPEHFDYSWTGLGRFAAAAVDALGIERFHLVVHDIGGPVGFELASRMEGRVLSLTILNTLIRAHEFKRPWSMEPFAHAGMDRIWLGSTRIKPMFRQLMYLHGIGDRSAVSSGEMDAYVDLLHRGDGGRAFLKMMKGFERTREKAALYESVASSDAYPVQVVWGKDDPAIRFDTHGRVAEEVTGTWATLLPGKHFFQEDSAEPLAEAIASFAKR